MTEAAATAPPRDLDRHAVAVGEQCHDDGVVELAGDGNDVRYRSIGMTR
jgi:hypothetical protein